MFLLAIEMFLLLLYLSSNSLSIELLLQYVPDNYFISLMSKSC